MGTKESDVWIASGTSGTDRRKIGKGDREWF